MFRSHVVAGCMGVVMVGALSAVPAWSAFARPTNQDAPPGGAEAARLTDDTIVYRGELAYRGTPLNGRVNLEFRFYATDSDTLPLGSTVEATDWPVEEGVVLVGLDFGSEADTAAGGWLEVTVDGVVLSPRQYVPARGWSMGGTVSREAKRAATIVEPEESVDADDDAGHDARGREPGDGEGGRGDRSRSATGRDGTSGLPGGGAREALRDGLLSGGGGSLIGGSGGDSLGGGGDGSGDGWGGFLFNAGDRFLSATDSVYINIDADNNNPDNRLFEIGKNRYADTGGTSLFRVNENGNIGVGTTDPQHPMHVNGILRVGGHTTGIGGNDGDYLFIQPNSTGLATFRFDQANLRFVNSNFGEIGRLTRDGRFGLGTTSPIATLEAVSNTTNAANNTARFSAPAIGPRTSHIHYGTTGDWYIRSAATDGKVIIQDGFGAVGIGTTNPVGKLAVNATATDGAMAIVAQNDHDAVPTILATNTGSGGVLWAVGDSDVSLGGGGMVVLGAQGGANMAIDNNEIMARNAGNPTTLYLNADGGDVRMGENRVMPAFAYGHVNQNATWASRSSNLTTISHPLEGRYEIGVDGGFLPTDIVVITSRFVTDNIATAYVIDGRVRVNIWSVHLDDNTDSSFFFVVYRP
jgi:hypothetical protein